VEERDYSAYVDSYRSLPVEELLKLHVHKSDLHAVAQQALEDELARRRAQVDEVKLAQATDRVADSEWDAKQREISTQRELRETKRIKWYLAILSPLAVLAFVSEPREAQDTFLRPATLILIVVVVWWSVILGQWIWLRKRKKAIAGDA
jgi:hypothetical protein